MKTILLIMIGLSVLNAEYIRDNANEVVLDTTTNLIWQDDADAKTLTKSWVDAIGYCEALTLGGKSDWRLPNFNELYALADRSKVNPAISDRFVNVASSFYWSSTTYVSYSDYAWSVRFYNGVGDGSNKTGSYYVRCVRSADN